MLTLILFLLIFYEIQLIKIITSFPIHSLRLQAETLNPTTNPQLIMLKKNLGQFLSMVAAIFILSVSAQSEEVYTQNFDDFDDGEIELGDGSIIAGAAASIQGGRLQLTIDGQGLGFSSFSIPPMEDSSKGSRMTFDYEMYDSVGNHLSPSVA